MKESNHYCIRIEGFLGRDGKNSFDGFAVMLTDDGDTCLSGPIRDQAALHGVLKKIQNLGMTIISVNQLREGEQNEQ